MTATNAYKAKLSYCVDVLATVSVLILCSCWIYSLNSSPPLLSPSFLENGFCLSPLFENTHLSCSYFDAFCGIICLLAVGFTKKSSLIGAAAYFFAHSYGHFDAAVSLTEEGAAQNTPMIGVKEMMTLAAILSVGPITSATDLIKAGKVSKSTGNTCAFLGLAAAVAVYAIYIRRPCYALLYINIFIILCHSLPQAALIGFTSKQDVESRASKFKWANTLSGVAVLIVVFCEPFFCDGFVKYIGGHAVFDTVLALDMFIQLFSSDGQAEKIAKKTA